MTNVVALHVCRWVSLALAVGLPLLFNKIAVDERARLRALMNHGVHTTGIVIRIASQVGKKFVHYRYSDGSHDYEWDIDADRAPGAVGVPIQIVYLEANPRIH